jgi:hypothetical protein
MAALGTTANCTAVAGGAIGGTAANCVAAVGTAATCPAAL